MSKLFESLKIKDIEFKNRIFVSPMCQYSAVNGVPQDWHLVHLGSRASGGASLVIAEATAVSPEGRISPGDTGLWNLQQAEAFKKITAFIKSQNSVPGVQIAHAGRKASCNIPWKGVGQLSLQNQGWTPVGPSSTPFQANDRIPHELNQTEIATITEQFKSAALFALEAGFQVLEIHMAHGYLLHEFLSPIANRRSDKYGGSIENRMRFPMEVTKAIRQVWPQELPLFVRISATDWIEGPSWDLEQSVRFCSELKTLGVDLIDCSSGGMSLEQKIKLEPGYQVLFAEEIRSKAKVLTGAVGLIKTASQAEEILTSGKVDAILIGREFLRDPHWALKAAQELNVKIQWPNQYLRA